MSTTPVTTRRTPVRRPAALLLAALVGATTLTACGDLQAPDARPAVAPQVVKGEAYYIHEATQRVEREHAEARGRVGDDLDLRYLRRAE
jgi:hypothetical protein